MKLGVAVRQMDEQLQKESQRLEPVAAQVAGIEANEASALPDENGNQDWHDAAHSAGIVKCAVPWGNMAGDACVRVCPRCHLSVFDLQSLSDDTTAATPQFTPLIGKKRLYRRTDGTFVEDDCQTRRHGWIATPISHPFAPWCWLVIPLIAWAPLRKEIADYLGCHPVYPFVFAASVLSLVFGLCLMMRTTRLVSKLAIVFCVYLSATLLPMGLPLKLSFDRMVQQLNSLHGYNAERRYGNNSDEWWSHHQPESIRPDAKADAFGVAQLTLLSIAVGVIAIELTRTGVNQRPNRSHKKKRT